MNLPKDIKVACIQHAATKDQFQNWQQTEAGIRDAKAQGAKLILLQELHSSIYFPHNQDVQYFDLAETIPGPSTEKLSQLARELGVVIVGSIFEKRGRAIYHNTAVVFEADGTCAGVYRKMHIPDDPGFNEKFYFTPGDLGFEPIQTSVGKLGVLVCWDQWFPEAARLMALRGADLLLYPTAIGWSPADTDEEQMKQLDAWQTVQRGHAIANGIPVLCANRIGFEGQEHSGGSQFWGHSFICGPQGEILCEAQNQACAIVAEIKFEQTEQVRRIWPFFRDRRIDAYQSLLKIFDDKREPTI